MSAISYCCSAIVIIGMITYLFVVIRQYKLSTYYQITGNSFFSVFFDKGRYGEYLIYKHLRSYESKGAKFLFNCYLPRDNNETTEIDVLMLYQSGLYVFESKNYGGWIFGNETGKTWTQTLPQGRKSHKEHFLNPIMQNKLHIKWLRHFLQSETIPIHSIIVFSERCTLKKVRVSPSNAIVIKRDCLRKTISKLNAKSEATLKPNQIMEIYTKLYPTSQVSDDIKQRHVDTINNKLKQGNLSEHSSQGISTEARGLLCPRCGATLILRMSKRGDKAGHSFYGCSSYPKCRYIKNIENTET